MVMVLKGQREQMRFGPMMHSWSKSLGKVTGEGQSQFCGGALVVEVPGLREDH